jgi:RNA polymerase sigma factor (sigma-70 family)
MTDIEYIYEKEFEKVYGFFYWKSHDRHTAEDLTSQTFLTFMEKVHEENESIRDATKYLYGVMKNIWLRYLQDKYKNPELYMENMDEFQDEVYEMVSIESTRTDEQRVTSYIEKLPKSQEVVMRMRLLNHLSLQEICSHLGRDMNYVKTTQKRGIANLKSLILNTNANERSIT